MNSIRMVCLACHAENEIEASSTAPRCFNCDNYLTASEGETLAPGGEEVILCPSCRRLSKHEDIYCRSCGVWLHDALTGKKYQLDPWSHLILFPVIGLSVGLVLGRKMGVFALLPIAMFTVIGLITGIFVFYLKR
jgi:hypothetical protein